MNWTEIVSIVAAAIAVSFGAVGPALAEGRAVAAAMDAIARQPEAAGPALPNKLSCGRLSANRLWAPIRGRQDTIHGL